MPSYFRDPLDDLDDEDDLLAMGEPLPDFRRGLPIRPGAFNEPSSDQRLDGYLGIDEPQLDDFEEAEFEVSPLERFLERVGESGGLAVQPRGFGQSLAAGLMRGMGGSGQRIAARRQKFEAAQAQRAAQRDQANLQATRDYRKERGAALRDLTKGQREDRRRQEEYDRENPKLTPSLLAVAPWLGRSFRPGENVPKDIYQGILKNMSPEAIAEMDRKAKADARDEKRLGFEGRRVKVAEDEAKRAAAPGAGKPPTEFQGRVQFFRGRAKEAAENAVKGGLENRVLNKAWSLQAPPAMQGDPDVREYWRSMEAFALALNRLESGAAIAPTEFAKVRQLYFVTPGDKPADVRAKVKLRESLIENLSRLQAPGAQQEESAGASITPAQLWEP